AAELASFLTFDLPGPVYQGAGAAKTAEEKRKAGIINRRSENFLKIWTGYDLDRPMADPQKAEVRKAIDEWLITASQLNHQKNSKTEAPVGPLMKMAEDKASSLQLSVRWLERLKNYRNKVTQIIKQKDPAALKGIFLPTRDLFEL